MLLSRKWFICTSAHMQTHNPIWLSCVLILCAGNGEFYFICNTCELSCVRECSDLFFCLFIWWLCCSALVLVNSENEDPTVRGLALRSLCNLRLESILEYIEQPLFKSLTDISAYVRKTGVMGILKVCECLLLL